ncbi:MAG: dipeptidase PepV [Clostridia bacterium]|nr:dipeptidase PepV [Clostridia bacterium]
MKFDQFIDEYQDAIITSTQELIRIKSTEEAAVGDYPFGEGVQKSLEYVLDLGKNLGFETKNVDNYAGYVEIGSGKEMVGVLAHLDVVPEGEGWTYPPYEGKVADGRIYGRGILDDKGPIIMTIYAMKAILDAGIPLNRRIRLILGTNEETNWQGIHYYLKHEEAPTMGFTPDADFPAIHGEKGIMNVLFEKELRENLNDGGVEVLSLSGGLRANMVPERAEATIKSTQAFGHILDAYNKQHAAKLSFDDLGDTTYKLISEGISAHGSTPEAGVNAIAHLLNFLDKLDLQIGDLSNFIRFYSRFIGLETNGESIGCGLEDQESGKLTFNPGVLKLADGKVGLEVNIRYPVTFKDFIVESGITSALDNPFDVTCRTLSHQGPIYMPKDHQLIKTLMGVYKRYTGDPSEPITIGGGTYARACDNVVAFGPLLPGRPELAHQKDEFMCISDFMLVTKIYATALYELAK